jgi:hypothetical protein
MSLTVFNQKEAQPGARNNECLPYFHTRCMVESWHGIMNVFPTSTPDALIKMRENTQ